MLDRLVVCVCCLSVRLFGWLGVLFVCLIDCFSACLVVGRVVCGRVACCCGVVVAAVCVVVCVFGL